MALEQTRDVVAALTALASAVEAAKADGVIDWADVSKLVPVVVAGQRAIAGADKIADELLNSAQYPQELADVLSGSLGAIIRLVQTLLK